MFFSKDRCTCSRWLVFMIHTSTLVAITALDLHRNAFGIVTVKSSSLRSLFTATPHLSDENRLRTYTAVPSRSMTTLSMVLFRSDRNNDDDSKGNQYGPGAAYIPLDDVLMYDQPITCDPDFPCLSDDDDDIPVTKKVVSDVQSSLLILIPAVTPFIAFFTFEWFAEAYNTFTDLLSRNNNWVAVDGGSYQAQIIAPAINGLVVPAVALLFATLISTTITTLRLRQVEIRRAINMEAGELRAMECLVDAIDPGFVQDQCRSYVRYPLPLMHLLFETVSHIVVYVSVPKHGVVNSIYKSHSL
jgi:Protein of unknown function (DUF4239)